ncbi:hypothetical protein MG293_006254 [Ovis ammon polii]|uniref:Uncharacterized protein n=1 Tax=Ovis ammon polii TaxID=230172 RepID=A0AAD4YA03_OVIAM|nr:hypothetical protein MG293_006254 [Ovis ammon polii]
MNRAQGRCEKQEGKGTDSFEALKVQTLSERFVKNDFISSVIVLDPFGSLASIYLAWEQEAGSGQKRSFRMFRVIVVMWSYLMTMVCAAMMKRYPRARILAGQSCTLWVSRALQSSVLPLEPDWILFGAQVNFNNSLDLTQDQTLEPLLPLSPHSIRGAAPSSYGPTQYAVACQHCQTCDPSFYPNDANEAALLQLLNA